MYGEDGNDNLYPGEAGRSPFDPPVVLDFEQIQSENGAPLNLVFRFDQNVSVAPASLEFVDSNGQLVPVNGATLSYDDASLTATWNIPASSIGSNVVGYRLTSSGIVNQTGLSLDGNSDGASGDSFAGAVGDGASNQLQVVDFSVNDGDDDYGSLRSISVSFSADVSTGLSPSALRLSHMITGQLLQPDSVVWDPPTNTATWNFDSPVNDAGYFITELLGDQIANGSTQLAGDYQTSGTDILC